MNIYPAERLAVVVDGQSLWSTAKALQIDVDYRALREMFASKGILVRAYYFTPFAESDEFLPIRPLVDWLDYHGWSVVTKAANGRRDHGNMDVDIAVTMLEMADTVDHFVLFAGSSDFEPLVDALQRRGRRVTVISSIKTKPPACTDGLRRQADDFVNLEDIKAVLMRAGKEPVGA